MSVLKKRVWSQCECDDMYVILINENSAQISWVWIYEEKRSYVKVCNDSRDVLIERIEGRYNNHL